MLECYIMINFVIWGSEI